MFSLSAPIHPAKLTKNIIAPIMPIINPTLKRISATSSTRTPAPDCHWSTSAYNPIPINAPPINCNSYKIGHQLLNQSQLFDHFKIFKTNRFLTQNIKLKKNIVYLTTGLMKFSLRPRYRCGSCIIRSIWGCCGRSRIINSVTNKIMHKIMIMTSILLTITYKTIFSYLLSHTRPCSLLLRNIHPFKWQLHPHRHR